MIEITAYLKYAKETKKELNRYEGIIIWNPAFGSLPQEVLFVPAIWDKKNNFGDFLKNKFSKDDFIIYQIYFQGMRWILPDLEERLNHAKRINIGLGKDYKLTYASYVAITFSPEIADEEIVEILSIKEVPIMVNEQKMTVKVQDTLIPMGNATLYENIDW